MADELRRTPLHGRHELAGARFGVFAGWDMPIRYGEVRAEHLAVRADVGCFDVSHMGRLEISGEGARGLLAEALTNDIDRVGVGEAQYTLVCQDDGGVIDDLIVYRLPDRYLAVVNAGNVAAVAGRLRELAPPGALVEDRSAATAMLAVQGPSWRRALAPHCPSGLATSLAPFRVATDELAGVACLVARTGYTGEPGVEIVCAAVDATALWDALQAGPHPPLPAGLGARDTLRLEMGYPLYGNELDRNRTPIEAGLAWACHLDGGVFRGADALRRRRERGTTERLVAFAVDGAGIARSGCAVVADGGRVGTVTSGSLSPSLGTGIGLAYVRAALAEPGTPLAIDIRGGLRPALVRRRPLVDTSPRKEES